MSDTRRSLYDGWGALPGEEHYVSEPLGDAVRDGVSFSKAAAPEIFRNLGRLMMAQPVKLGADVTTSKPVSLADFLLSEKDTRPYWETEHRALLAPLVMSGYNNSVSYGVPGILGGHGVSVLADVLAGNPVPRDEMMRGAGDVAGAAMMGSMPFGAARGGVSVGSGGGRMSAPPPLSLDERVARIKAAIDEAPSSHWYKGLRKDDGVEIPKGESFPNSRVWRNGDPTSDFVDGTSVIGLPEVADAADIKKALGLLNNYYGDKTHLVAGKYRSYGEDKGEHVLSHAISLGLYANPQTAAAIPLTQFLLQQDSQQR